MKEPELNSIPGAPRWYLLGVFCSILAALFLTLAHMAPRYGYPLGFTFTVFGALAISQPAWQLPEQRPRLVLVNSGVFVTQAAIVWLGMNSTV